MQTISKADSRIFRLLKILLGACLATPLLASASFIFPYTAPKAFAFRVLVEIAAVFYFYLALKYPENFLPTFFSRHCEAVGRSNPVDGGNSSGLPRRPAKAGLLATTVAVLFFLVVNFLSAIGGVDFYTSWWGNLERMAGVWGLAHFAVWFFMLTSVFKEPEDWKLLIKLSVVTSAAVAATALLQRLGGLGELLPATNRIYGLIGNAGVLAGYLLFNVFLAGYLAVSSLRGAERRSNPVESELNTGLPRCAASLERSGASRNDKMACIVYCLLLAINCLALFFTGTRGAMLGLLAGIIVFLLLWATKNFYFLWKDEKSLTSQPPFKRGARGVRIPAIILLTIIIFIGVLFLARGSAFVKNNSVLSRLTHISLSDATSQSRLILWQGAWQAWQARPLLGFGPANFEAAVGPYLSPRLIGFEAYAFDRAHNFIFDYGVTTGWLGLISYLAFFGAALRLLIKSLLLEPFNSAQGKLESKANMAADPSTRAAGASLAQGIKNDYYFPIIFISLLVAYLVQNLFIFDSFVSYLMLFFVLAIVNNVSLRGVPPRLSGAAQRSNPACASPEASARRVESEINMGLPRRTTPLERSSAPRNDNFSVFKKTVFLLVSICLLFFVYAFNLRPLLAAYRANQILSLPASDAAQAASLLKDALALNSFASPEIAYQAAIDYTEKINQNPALAQNEEFYNIAASELSKIIERSPNRARNYIALAWLNLYFSNQHPDRINESISLAGQIIELSPTKKDAYLILVAGYTLSNQPAKAEEIILRATAIDGKMGEEVKGYWEKLR